MGIIIGNSCPGFVIRTRFGCYLCQNAVSNGSRARYRENHGEMTNCGNKIDEIMAAIAAVCGLEVAVGSDCRETVGTASSPLLRNSPCCALQLSRCPSGAVRIGSNRPRNPLSRTGSSRPVPPCRLTLVNRLPPPPARSRAVSPQCSCRPKMRLDSGRNM